MNLRKAVFLDRDGTIIEDMEFSVDVSELRPLPGALDALRRLQQAGFLLVIVTNQSGVARGLFDEASLRKFHEHLLGLLRHEGIEVRGIYYCPHYTEGSLKRYAKACGCRKPAPGMLLQAAKEHGIDLSQSWMVGDRPCDTEAGRGAGCRTIRISAGDEDDDPCADFQAADLQTVAEMILVQG